MKTHIQTAETEETTLPGRAARMAEVVATGRRIVTAPLEWQALLLRYLPEPISTSQSVKRFAVR